MSVPTPLTRPQKAVSFLKQRTTRRRDDEVLYSAFQGRYSDNPRAIYEELIARGTDLTHTWHADGRARFPDAVRTITLDDPGYPRALGRAGIVVANSQVPRYAKPRGATYLQTWHGTPLKRVGLDNPRRYRKGSGLGRAVRDYAQWDFLVSQNPFSTETLRRAFAYDGEVLEVGYPRNDALLAPDAAATRERVRADLGIPDGVTAVLYAPTFRDDELFDGPGFRLQLDLDRLQAQLGDGFHVLLRLHYWVAERLGHLPAGFATDVSDHGDIRELYLATDALVTDYSSAMFDVAVTGKPIVLYTYDLERYRDDLRGFYFDITEQAPGPLCRTTDEVAAALGDLEGTARAHAGAYAEFAARFVPHDDGHASARVVDRLLAARR